MRAKTLILFMIAISCGLVASIGVSQYMERAPGSGQQVETAKIFVAVNDINIGQKLTAENVRQEDWPKARLPEGTIASLEDLQDRFPRTRLYAGEPILRAKLMDSNDGSKSVDIPKGFRAVSVKVSMESSVSGLVQPGDRVDLVVFLRKNGEVPTTGTKTILRDVNVFAVDSETERNVDSNGTAYSLRTVSLLVKPDQAEAVTLASGLGQLFLTLRRPDDDMEENSEGVTVSQLLGESPQSAELPGDSQIAAQPGNGVAGGGPGFVQWLAQTATALAPEAAPGLAEPEPAAWTMKILTPEGCREFRWRNVNELPEEVTSPPAETAVTPVSRESTLPATEPPAASQEVKLHTEPQATPDAT